MDILGTKSGFPGFFVAGVFSMVKGDEVIVSVNGVKQLGTAPEGSYLGLHKI